VRTLSSVERHDYEEEICLFCDESGGTAGLHCAGTHDINRNVRKCAIELDDSFLLAKLAAGDMIAIEAKYHSKCLAALYNKVNQMILIFMALHWLNWLHLWRIFAWNKIILLCQVG